MTNFQSIRLRTSTAGNLHQSFPIPELTSQASAVYALGHLDMAQPYYTHSPCLTVEPLYALLAQYM